MFRGFKEFIFFKKGKHSLAETRKSQGPFKGPCKAQRRTMAGHGPCWGKLLCPYSPLIWFFIFRIQKYGQFSRFSPVGHFLAFLNHLIHFEIFWTTLNHPKHVKLISTKFFNKQFKQELNNKKTVKTESNTVNLGQTWLNRIN